MSPEPGPGAERSERRWSLVHQGSFVRGRCDVCGLVSPARRARYTVESDLAAHELLCQASEDLGPAVLAAGQADARGAADRTAGVAPDPAEGRDQP